MLKTSLGWNYCLPYIVLRYVRSASVFHSHPLTLGYWQKRYYDSGLAEQYIENICKLHWPWRGQSNPSNRGRLRKFTHAMRVLLAEALAVSRFLFRNRYHHCFFIAPLFVVMRKFYYRKGLQKGAELYPKPDIKLPGR